jgi:hypothetical protein
VQIHRCTFFHFLAKLVALIAKRSVNTIPQSFNQVRLDFAAFMTGSKLRAIWTSRLTFDTF